MLPISSYAIVLYAALLHLIQALILLGSRTADGSIGLHSLLAVIPDRRSLAAALIASSSAAFVVLSRRYLAPWLTVILLTPQQALLFTTGIAASLRYGTAATPMGLCARLYSSPPTNCLVACFAGPYDRNVHARNGISLCRPAIGTSRAAYP
jgi:hypothetical protein